MPDPAEPHIDAALVTRLIASQFPQWADLTVRPVTTSGWDNRTFRLGDRLSVRLPSAARYAAQVIKEQTWLPRLAPALPLPIPTPVAQGRPGDGYPWAWSVYGWLPGEAASVAEIADLNRFAGELAGFLRALQAVDATAGPPAGPHSFYRGGPLATCDRETRDCLAQLGAEIDGRRVLQVWEAALESRWDRPPVWVHGDVAAGNLLVDAGRLSAVIDFGCSAVGDPACDLTIAWTLLDRQSRAEFRAALDLDADTWARGRGWASWKSLLTLTGGDPERSRGARAVLAAVLEDADG